MRSDSSNTLKMDKFFNEIALTSTLHHPNIVLFYGACVEVPNICLVMEVRSEEDESTSHKLN